MQDYYIRATAAGGTVMAFAGITTEMVQMARIVHSLSPVASAALGRTMTAAALMSALMKGEKDTLTIQIKGDGPLGGIVVVSDSKANVRGYVYNSDVYLPLKGEGKLDVSGAVGKDGYLNVIQDMGLKEPYIGFVKLVSGEIAEDIAYYFASSEQIPTVVSLGVKVDADESILCSGGFIIQLLPGAEESLIEHLEKTVKDIPSITKLLSSGETPESVLKMIFGENDLKITDKVPCHFQCNCSRERMEKNLICLGRKEIEELINDHQGAELHCHFCNKKYQFSEEELRQISILLAK